jgi:hypothetical protein
MKFGKFGDPTSFSMKGYKCEVAGCTRAYNSHFGYFDLVDDRGLWQKEQQRCPDDDQPMYLEAVNQDGTETWRCAGIGCNYSQQFVQDPVSPTQK